MSVWLDQNIQLEMLDAQRSDDLVRKEVCLFGLTGTIFPVIFAVGRICGLIVVLGNGVSDLTQ